MLKAKAYIGSNERDSFWCIKNQNEASEAVFCDAIIANEALLVAQNAKKAAKQSPLYQRIAWLNDAAVKIKENRYELAMAVTQETGKPIKYSLVETDRCASTIALCAAELINMQGETFSSDAIQGNAKAIGFWQREPVGVVVAITPFNFPLNLAAHKIAPALAMGNCVVLKPAPETPYSAYLLAKIFIESEYAVKDALSIVYGDADVGEALVSSDIPRVISFTGSVSVGKIIIQKAGIKKVSLELGGNAGIYIDKTANLTKAAARCALGAFINSGQVCVSLQRIYVHADIYDEFSMLFAKECEQFTCADPVLETTIIGPMINEDAAKRAEVWLNEAMESGAILVCGGKRDGLYFDATVLTNVTDDMKIVCEEVFAPIVSIMKVSSQTQAIDRINAMPYGLQHAVFTESLTLVKQAIDLLECGGVLINEMPTLRVDNAPYGGIKLSGIGREGPRFAMEEFSEIKNILIY